MFNRTITKPKSLGLEMSEDMIFHKAVQALRFPEGQLPIVLSALQTSGESTSVKALKDLTIKMYETHKTITDHTDVYAVNPGSVEEEEEASEETESEVEWEYADESGQTYLMRPKKKSKGENAPGLAEAARRGDVANFRNYPNSKSPHKGFAKGGKGPCLRCGGPNRWHRDCPLPWREVLDNAPIGKGKGSNSQKGKGETRPILTLEHMIPAIEEEAAESAQMEETPIPVAGSTPPVLAEESPEVCSNQEQMDDWWSQFYAYDTYPNYARTTVRTYKSSVQKLNGHELNEKSPLILLDSGASITEAGQKWLKWWDTRKIPLQQEDTINFRFGNGPPRPSQGTCVMTITIPPETTNQAENQDLQIEVHIVTEDVPLLISRDSLSRLGDVLDFRESSLQMGNGLKIQLVKTPSGHLMLPGKRNERNRRNEKNLLGNTIYAAALDVPTAALSKEELRKIHLHLGHCSESTLISMLWAAHISAPSQLIKELYESCKCQTGIHRVAPPNVS